MSSLMVYCRFCAEEKPSQDMINFMSTEEQRNELIEKLALFGIVFVDFDNNTLPQYICENCCKSLEFCYDFFVTVRGSQVILEDVFSNQPKFTLNENAEEENQENNDPDCDTHFEEAPEPSWDTYPWTCSHCDLTVDSLTSLRAHTKSLHNTCHGYSCADCDEKVDGLEEFVTHVIGHREELRNHCEHCNIITSDRSHRDTHWSDHCCTLCGETFTDEPALLAHLKQYATKSTGLLAFNISINESNDYDTSEIKSWSFYPSICKFCKMQVFNKEIISHCMSFHGPCFGMQCIDCDEQTDTFTEFIEHVYTHRPELKTYCPYCDTKLTEEFEYYTHIETHTHTRYPCTLCGETFAHRHKLYRHRAAVRSALDTSSQKKRKAPLTEEDLTCKTCGVVLKSEASLRNHENVHKVREKHYTCEICGLAYYQKGSLDSHLKTHDDSIKETCKICKKTFLTLTRLRKHVQTHNPIKTYQCDHCKKFYSSKERLRAHITTHFDVFPYKCDFCAKKFRHKTVLKVHENQHTGVRPYSCEFCEMVFSNWSNCNKHMKRKHNSTLAKSAMTPLGRVPLNPKTGKPYRLDMDPVVKEWSEKILSVQRKCKNRGKELDRGSKLA